MKEMEQKPFDTEEEQTEHPISYLETKEKAEVEIKEQKEKTSKFHQFMKEIMSYVLIVFVAFIAARIIHTYFFTPISVSGESMETTVHDGDFIILWRLGDFERYDVVVFQAPSGEYYIKRLIGLPGDYVESIDDTLYINGQAIEEPYLEEGKEAFNGLYTPNFNLDDKCYTTDVRNRETQLNCDIDGRVQIPEGYYLVLGDNRPNSHDSTELGLFKEEEFIGKAEFILFPLKRLGKL